MENMAFVSTMVSFFFKWSKTRKQGFYQWLYKTFAATFTWKHTFAGSTIRHWKFNFEYCHVITNDILFRVGLVGLEQLDSQLMRSEKVLTYLAKHQQHPSPVQGSVNRTWWQSLYFQRNPLTSSKVGVFFLKKKYLSIY